MDIRVGIALFSMMITVITFLGGFMVLAWSRVLTEVSILCGVMEGMVGYIEKKEKKKDALGRRVIAKYRKAWKKSRNSLFIDLGVVIVIVVGLMVFLFGVSVENVVGMVVMGGFVFCIGMGNIVYGMVKVAGNLDRVVRESRKFEMIKELDIAGMQVKPY